MRAKRDFPFAFPASATELQLLLLPHSETAMTGAGTLAADTRDGASQMQIVVAKVVVVAAAGPGKLDCQPRRQDITVAVD